MNAPTDTGKNRPANMDPRLIALDPDFDELFAEVEEALCVVRVPWVPRLRTASVPRPRAMGRRRPPSRPRGRRPRRFRARERGPPERRRRPRHPQPVQK
ncbi:hypothetical protein [Nocardia rhamnosiphila]